jgi:hypothetical protein
MPIPIRERVLAALAARLVAELPDVAVERNRDSAVSRYPALVVVDGDQAADHGTAGITQYTAQAVIEGYAQAATPAGLGPVLNDLYGRTLAAAVADPTLGGIAVDVREREMTVVVERGEGGKPTAAFSLAIEIEFFTALGDPFAAAP